MQEDHHLNGSWTIAEVPDSFIQIMKHLGYSGMERKYFKKSKMTVYSTILDDNKLEIKLDSPFYKTSKEYSLNNTPIEYEDDNKNSIMEISRWINDKTVEVKTFYLDKNLTVVDTREITSDGHCIHKVSLITCEDPEPIEAEMLYKKKEKLTPMSTIQQQLDDDQD